MLKDEGCGENKNKNEEEKNYTTKASTEMNEWMNNENFWEKKKSKWKICLKYDWKIIKFSLKK